jgi:hypothetical protein
MGRGIGVAQGKHALQLGNNDTVRARPRPMPRNGLAAPALRATDGRLAIREWRPAVESLSHHLAKRRVPCLRSADCTW